MEKLLIFDSNSFIHRAFHAIPETLTNEKGEKTNAIYGFFLMILSIIQKEVPAYLLFTFDSKEKTFRHSLFNEYKATRVKAPDSLYEQLETIKEALNSFNCMSFAYPGYEGDDIIGTLSENLSKNFNTLIFTGDMDAFQLVKENVTIGYLGHGFKNMEYYNEKEVLKRFSINPNQIPDMKALCGDKSDNIPGVDGIGPKKAVFLLNKFQTIENIYINIDKIDGQIKNLLSSAKEIALLSKKLATIKKDMDINFDIKKASIKNLNLEMFKNFLEKYGCFTLIKKIDTLRSQINTSSQLTLF